MEMGGLRHDGEKVFLLSTTHGSETHSLVAAMETMRICVEEEVVAALHRQGDRLRRGVGEVTTARGLGDHFQVLGRPSNLIFATLDQEGQRSQPFRTLFLQELLKRGVLAPSFVISYSHTDDDVDQTVEAVDGALEVYARALEDGVQHHLEGRSVKPVFRRHN
jgi:glutamate-1-semialdehyde 2,1-aminomutase